MHIILDVFPANFSGTPANTFPDVHDLNPITTHLPNVAFVQTTRVVMTSTHITVAKDSPNGAEIIFHEPYSMFYRSDTPEGPNWVVTSTGKQIAFQKDTNCGCGSRLRSWNPYKTLNSINDPTE